LAGIVGVITLLLFLPDWWLKSQAKDQDKFMQQIKEIAHSYGEEDETVVWNFSVVIVVIMAFSFLIYREWRKGVLFLVLPTVITAFVVMYSAFLGVNATMFFHILSFYVFVRAFVYFLDKANSEGKFTIVPDLLKIFLEITRIAALILLVLNFDGTLNIDVLPSFVSNLFLILNDVLLRGVIATIAIDSTIATFKKLTSARKAKSNEALTNTEGTALQSATDDNEIIEVDNETKIQNPRLPNGCRKRRGRPIRRARQANNHVFYRRRK